MVATLAPAQMNVIPLKRGCWDGSMEGLLIPSWMEVKSLDAYAEVPYVMIGSANCDLLKATICEQMPAPLAAWVRDCFVMSEAQLEKIQNDVSQALLQRLAQRLGWVVQPVRERTLIARVAAALRPKMPKPEFSQMEEREFNVLGYDVLRGEIAQPFADSKACCEYIELPRPLSSFLEHRYVATQPSALVKAWQVCAERFRRHLESNFGMEIKMSGGFFDLPEDMEQNFLEAK